MKLKALFFVVVVSIIFAACNNSKDFVETSSINFGDETETVIETLTTSTTVAISETEGTTEQAVTENTTEQTVSETENTTEAAESEITTQQPEEEINIEAIAWIIGDGINFREQSSLDADVISRLKKSQEVMLYSITGDWAYIQVDNTKGFIHKDFVSTNEPAAEVTTVAPQQEQETVETVTTVALVENVTTQAESRASEDYNRSSLTIAIDAGHQAKGNSEHELIGPGASTTKPKVSSGTTGISTGVPEYKLTLAVSLKLRDELIARGYNVFMIRETHDVNISNKERAGMATEAGADIFVRIHADGSENTSINGILTFSPTAKNPYIAELYKESYSLSKIVVDAMVEETGAKNRGVLEADNMSGINWATMPVTIVEMGLMTNAKEDELMQTDDYQRKLAVGIANGIDKYFSSLAQ